MKKIFAGYCKILRYSTHLCKPLICGTGIAVDAAQEANLLAGNWYVNIHTSNFTGGEIRGQVLVAPIPEPTGVALAAAAILSLAGLARRRPIDLA